MSQTLLFAPSLKCSFAADYHLNYPRQAPIWPCNSVDRAAMICSGGLGFEPHRGSEISSLSPYGPISFLGLWLRSVIIWLTTFRDQPFDFVGEGKWGGGGGGWGGWKLWQKMPQSNQEKKHFHAGK